MLCADGVWRTLDSQGIHKIRPAAGAVAERTTERAADLVAAGAAGDAPGRQGPRDPRHPASRCNDLFSSRRRAITPKTAELVAAFETKHGRAPERAGAGPAAPASHLRHPPRQVARRRDAPSSAWTGWTGSCAPRSTAAWPSSPPTCSPSPDKRAGTGAVVAGRGDRDRAGRRPVHARPPGPTADLTRAINDALPDHLGDRDGAQIAELLDHLTAEALEAGGAADAGPARPSGPCPTSCAWPTAAPPTRRPGARLYATPEHMHTERLLAAGHRRTRRARARPRPPRGRFLDELREAGVELGADQAAAVRGVLTSGAQCRVAGRAGRHRASPSSSACSPTPGKTPRSWDGQQRKVVGLASSQIATDVLAGEGLHRAQHHPLAGHPATPRRRERRSATTGTGGSARATWSWSTSPRWPTPPTSPPSTDHVSAAGAKLLLTGDHRQLAAVGAAGGMQLAAETGAVLRTERSPPVHPRVGTRRLTAAARRRRDACSASTTSTAGSSTPARSNRPNASAARAWLADTLAGEAVAADRGHQRTSRQAVRADPRRPRPPRPRRRGRRAARPAGHDRRCRRPRPGPQEPLGPRRRARATGAGRSTASTTACSTRSTTAAWSSPRHRPHQGERITLPGCYVAEHVALGYASTVHAAQGLTVDTGHAVITHRTGPAALYVALTRGRDAQHRARGHPRRPRRRTDRHRQPGPRTATRSPSSPPRSSSPNPNSPRWPPPPSPEHEAESIRTPGELFADACEHGHRRAHRPLARPARRRRPPHRRSSARSSPPRTAPPPSTASCAGRTRRPRPATGPRTTRSPAGDLARRAATDQRHPPPHHRHRHPRPGRRPLRRLDPRRRRPGLADLPHRARRTPPTPAATNSAHQVADEQPQWAIEALGPVPDDDQQREHVAAAGRRRRPRTAN